jgi:hypothetical protein
MFDKIDNHLTRECEIIINLKFRVNTSKIVNFDNNTW